MDGIHIDVMDGHFVPNLTIGPVIVEAIRPLTRLPLESHLMIENPSYYIDNFIEAGSDIISIHAECYGVSAQRRLGNGFVPRVVEKIDVGKAKADIQKIKKRGKKAFMVMNPGTPLCIQSLLKEIDGVLMMSVNPGFARQKFMPDVLSKIRDLRSMFQGDIAIDGGINETTAADAVKAGVNILATASYFFGASDPTALVRHLKSLNKK